MKTLGLDTEKVLKINYLVRIIRKKVEGKRNESMREILPDVRQVDIFLFLVVV